ncbi:hypothetical protein LCGC14_1456300 [marine sediment metagenome]|uniref:Uncharacterized protein n=1 Tax=marine sediment metagenome TaxID=412755 RepID=A0A0F9MIA2_9ZZZZ
MTNTKPVLGIQGKLSLVLFGIIAIAGLLLIVVGCQVPESSTIALGIILFVAGGFFSSQVLWAHRPSSSEKQDEKVGDILPWLE